MFPVLSLHCSSVHSRRHCISYIPSSAISRLNRYTPTYTSTHLCNSTIDNHIHRLSPNTTPIHIRALLRICHSLLCTPFARLPYFPRTLPIPLLSLFAFSLFALVALEHMGDCSIGAFRRRCFGCIGVNTPTPLSATGSGALLDSSRLSVRGRPHASTFDASCAHPSSGARAGGHGACVCLHKTFSLLPFTSLPSLLSTTSSSA